MNRLSDRVNSAHAQHLAWIAEREDQRTRDMFSQIGWMLVEAVLVTAFLFSFR